MILSNCDILDAIRAGHISIEPLAGQDPGAPPFNTSAIDLKLADEILVPKSADDPIALRLDRKFNSDFITRNWEKKIITSESPYSLTLEMINLGPFDLLLCPHINICQLIIECVSGTPQFTPNTFARQTSPQGRPR